MTSLWIALWVWGGAGIAAKLTGRHFIGVEIDEKYFLIAKQRIDDTEGFTAVEEEVIEEPLGQLTFF